MPGPLASRWNRFPHHRTPFSELRESKKQWHAAPPSKSGEQFGEEFFPIEMD
jgi:hypothetical protein